MIQEGITVEIPWTIEDAGRHVCISGSVIDGARRRVEGFRCTDQRTGEDLELPDWARDDAEAELVAEAERMWSQA